MPPEEDQTVLVLLLFVGMLSLASLFYLFQKHLTGQPLLAYEPRRRVPWGVGVVLLGMSMPMLGVLAFAVEQFLPTAEVALREKNEAEEDGTDADLQESEEETVSTETLLINGWGNFGFMVLFVAGVSAWITSFYGADQRDLGLPTSWRQFVQDVLTGTLATLACLIPIYAVQFCLLFLLQPETHHPLVEQLSEHPSPGMLILGFAMAVIGAPLFEEFVFRGLLQGWLENCEDQATGFAATKRFADAEVDARGHGDQLLELETPRFDDALEAVSTTKPARGWLPALPHGWTPILISGFVFGLAHLGHGVAPISLVLFGIVLGYLYQRTHRLVPSITAHMVFNAFSMTLLWFQLESPPVDKISP